MKRNYILPRTRVLALDEELFLAASASTGVHVGHNDATVGGFGDDALTNKQTIWNSDNVWLEE